MVYSLSNGFPLNNSFSSQQRVIFSHQRLWDAKHESIHEFLSKSREVVACVHSAQSALHTAERFIIQFPGVASRMLSLQDTPAGSESPDICVWEEDQEFLLIPSSDF